MHSYRFIFFAIVFALIPSVNAETELTGKPWIDMNYGPYLTASIEVTPGNIAYKGIAIRLDDGEGGIARGSQFVVFDTDTLRMAGGWDESFINWQNILFDGSHGTHSKIAGPLTFENRVGPGWSNPANGDFIDNRLRGHDDLPYGPLDRSWAKWNGLYVHGDQVVLSYRVGDADILESPGRETHADSIVATTRTFEIGPRDHELVLQVAHGDHAWTVDQAAPRLAFNSSAGVKTVAKTVADRGFRFDGAHQATVAQSKQIDWNSKDYTLYVRFRTKKGGTLLAAAPSEGEWVPDGQTLFVRGGRLGFDIGWVGAVMSKRKVNDGKWHDAALVYDRQSGVAQLVIDGEVDNQEELRPNRQPQGFVTKIGFTSPDFPEPSPFVGRIAEARFYQAKVDVRRLIKGELPTENLVAHWVTNKITDGRFVDQSGNDLHAKVGNVSGGFSSPKAARQASFAIVGENADAQWRIDGQDLRLIIEPSDQTTRVKIVCGPYGGIARKPPPDFVQLVAHSVAPEPLEPLTRGGPANWQQTVETEQTILGDEQGEYVVETVTAPLENPYRSWMRLGGFDFFADADRMAVGTWMGDLWIVEGITATKFSWRRVATGMFQPLGVRIVDDQIYVCNRDQITRLHDLNGDGMMDFYENFNNDHQVTEHFHEFAMDLQTDADGNFYYAKSARHAKDSLVPHHGTLIRVSPDGAQSEIVCNGFRAANGVGIGPNGELATSDQEGHWTPTNRINLVKENAFYGNMYSYHRGERPTGYEPPVVWLPRPVDRSPAEQLWVDSDQWGPLEGRMLSLSYGTGKAFLVNYEQVGGVYQGSAMEMPIAMFPTGVMRGRFHPDDGQLYACGLFGWSSNRTQPGGMYRIRYTGKPLHVPVGVHVTGLGVDLTFPYPLDEDAATDPENYVVKQWNYRWTANYGSDHYSVTQPNRKGEDEVYVEDVTLSEDKKTVSIELEEIKPVMQMEIRLTIEAADGAEIDRTIYNTINVVP